MASRKQHSVLAIGDGGLAILIPIHWARYYGLKPKDKVELIIDEELGTIKIKPIKPSISGGG